MKTKEISQREKSEESAWKSEGNFKLFQSSVFDVIYRYDPQNNKYDFISSSVELQTEYTVKVASDGSQGLQLCRRERFDVVLTDLGMPEMSGWEVAKAVKEIDSNTTVLLITGWGVEMEEEKLKESGIDRVLAKPVKLGDLLNLVSGIIQSKRIGKEAGEDALKHPAESKDTRI